MLKLLSLTGLIVLLDQVTKFLIITNLKFQEIIEINSNLKIVYFRNDGAAFGFLNDAGGWQRYFLRIVGVVAAVIIPFLIKKYRNEKTIVAALVLILAGALGNLYDRFSLGYVIDFILFHIDKYYWPAFNVADTSISIGAILLIYDSIKNTNGASK